MTNKRSQFGYYPGCALHGSSSEYDRSVRAVTRVLEADLREIDDWNCCGASAGHMLNHKLARNLSLRNLALAEQQQIDALLAPCPMCSKELLSAAGQIADDAQARAEAEDAIEMSYGGGVTVLNYIQYLQAVGLDRLQERIVRKLDGMQVACYYGCLLTRPPGVLQFDDAEQPEAFERIVLMLGARPVDFAFKTECCGGGFTQSNARSVVRLCHRILQNAKTAGATVIAAACPMCQMNLDMRQKAVEQEYGERFGLPIVYLSQLVGLALGIEPAELGLNRHFVSTTGITGT